jgi:hypothetical protein
MGKNVCGVQKLDTTQMPINSGTDEFLVYLFNVLYYVRKNDCYSQNVDKLHITISQKMFQTRATSHSAPFI